MRALNKSWIGIGLAILFGASLFFFRGSARYSNLFNSDNFVANVSGTQISTSHFMRSLEMNIGQFAQMIGEDLTGDQIRSFQIHQLVLQDLVSNAVFENEFDKLNYILDDSVIATKTKERFPNLYLNNKINEEALNSFLRLQRLKIDDLVNIINYETRSVVFDNLFFSKNYPIKFSNKINLFNEHSRSIQLTKLPFEKITLSDLNVSNITKENKDLIDYFEKNSINYMTQEKRDISYIIIDKNNYKNKFIPSQNEISNYFNNNKGLFAKPEQRSFKQFNFKTKEEAEAFKFKISGLNKNEIINFASNNEIKYNNFENLNKNQVLDELSEVIFSIDTNQVSEIITTTLAYHIIILDEIIQKKEAVLSDVSDEIKDTLINVQLDNFFNDLKLNINQQILNGVTMNELALENDLDIEENYNVIINSDEEYNLKNAIINTAFTLNKDFISDIKDFDNDVSFVLNVDEIYETRVKEIDTIFKELRSDYIKFKKLNYADKIYTENKSDSNLKNINSIFEAESEDFEVSLTSSNLPNSLLRDIFNTNLNSIVFSSDYENTYFALVTDIEMPNESNNNEVIKLNAELKNAFGNEIIKTKKISLNDELINGLLSQYK